MKIFSTLFGKSENTFTSTIHFFRSIGFFDQYEGSDKELANMLVKEHIEKWGKPYDPTDQYSDLTLLSLDTSRIWWKDTEADVCSGNSVYKRTLQEWSLISRGAFLPENITEYWETEEGPIQVNFDHENSSYVLQPEFLDDYIDLRLLSQINRLIMANGKNFEMFRPFDQTGFVVVLTGDEKKLLQRERGWQFVD